MILYELCLLYKALPQNRIPVSQQIVDFIVDRLCVDSKVLFVSYLRINEIKTSLLRLQVTNHLEAFIKKLHKKSLSLETNYFSLTRIKTSGLSGHAFYFFRGSGQLS